MTARSFPLLILAGATIATEPAGADLIDNDTTIRNSLCVGESCANSESFAGVDLKLKAQNLSVQFEDTSNPTGGFPHTDWRLTVNSTQQHGSGFFALEDLSAGTEPFRVEASAPSNALVVEADGDIGLGTAEPATNLHVIDGDSPALRLQQDGSGGMPPRIWDMVGNETAFFLRDVTGGQSLPFKVHPDTPSDMLTVSPSGVGIGVSPAAATLEIQDSDETLVILRDTSDQGPQEMLRLENYGVPMLYFLNTKSNRAWTFSAGGNFRLSPSADLLQSVFLLSNTGDLSIEGALTQSSDATRKIAIEPVDPHAILAKVAALPLAEWSYDHDADRGIRHVGPMAQDFHAAFGLGADETGISSLDSNGVALAAIQALLARIEVLEAQLAAR